MYGILYLLYVQRKTTVNKRLFKTLQGKFLIITITLMIIIAIIVSIFSYFIFLKNLQNNMIHAAETNLLFISNDINNNIARVEEITNFCRTNTDILSYLHASSKTQNSALVRAAHEKLSEEYMESYINTHISRVIIASTNGEKFLQKMAINSYSVPKNYIDIFSKLPYFAFQLQNPSDNIFSIGAQKEPFINTEELILPVIYPIYSPYSSDLIAFCYLQVSLSIFTETLNSFSNLENIPIFLTVGSDTYKIYDNNVIKLNSKFNTQIVTDITLSNGNTQVHETVGETEQSFYVSTALRTDNCFISIPVSKASVHSVSPEYQIILFVIIFIVVIVGLFLYIFLSQFIGTPVSILKLQINQIAQGNFEQNSEIEWDNEFGDIGRDINSLAINIQNLLHQRIAYEKQKKDYEYQVLQSQINPHFLYNTLNSIKWMAIAIQATGIAEMTTSLAHLMKNISKGNNSLITIQDEITLLNDYFTIQKYRYGGTISLEYSIEDPTLLNNQILRFTLQPIVENSIFHGIEPKNQNGYITIHIYKISDSAIEIDITDNGIGMSSELIEQVLNNTRSEPFSLFKQIGVGSVNKRIQYNFGIEYGLSIESIPGEYTIVKIVIPAQSMKEKENLQK